ncbi:MAG TPA: hypothetical protein PLD02_10535, partial [Saprospiraceae bacterium]|nr:hypothetical protein [Saprospiraceae bacterium]
MKLRFTRFSIIFACTLIISNHVFSQVDLVASGGTTMMSYTTVKDAFDAINAGTHTGTITLNISGNTTEPATGAVLNASGSGSSNYTSITIKPTGGAARIISGAANAGSPLINLNGADNVTIDGLNTGGNSLTIENTTVSSTSGTSTLKFESDATNNLITKCSINGASTMPTGTNGGNIYFGASAITTGSDNNTISFCKIGPSGANLPTKGIYGNGTGTSTTHYNSNITITDCEIYDFFNATAQSNGIYMTSANTDWNILNNKFYQTATRTQTTAASNIAIQLASANINNCLISGNVIGYSNASGTGVYTLSSTVATLFIGISVSVGTVTPTSVQGNTISSISNTTSSGASTGSGILCGIAAVAGNINIGNITGNTIGVASGTASLIATPSTSTGAIVGINSASTDNIIIQNNTIGGFQCIGSTSTIASAVHGINVSGAATSITITGNTIGNATANNMVAGTLGTSTGATIAIGINATSVPVTANYSNNTIQNFASNGSGTGNCRGIFTSTTTNVTSVHTINNNIINNLSTNSSLTGATSGLTAAAGIHYFPGLNSTISNNTISNISGLNTGLVNTVITGIACANA